jgi:hypothetical protein
MEVVQKTLDTVQARFNHEVTTTLQAVFRRELASCCVLEFGFALECWLLVGGTKIQEGVSGNQSTPAGSSAPDNSPYSVDIPFPCFQKEKFDKAAARQIAVNRRMKESNILRDKAAGNRCAPTLAM